MSRGTYSREYPADDDKGRLIGTIFVKTDNGVCMVPGCRFEGKNSPFWHWHVKERSEGDYMTTGSVITSNGECRSGWVRDCRGCVSPALSSRAVSVAYDHRKELNEAYK